MGPGEMVGTEQAEGSCGWDGRWMGITGHRGLGQVVSCPSHPAGYSPVPGEGLLLSPTVWLAFGGLGFLPDGVTHSSGGSVTCILPAQCPHWTPPPGSPPG